MLRRDDNARVRPVAFYPAKLFQKLLFVGTARLQGPKKQCMAQFLLHDRRQKNVLLFQQPRIARQELLNG